MQKKWKYADALDLTRFFAKADSKSAWLNLVISAVGYFVMWCLMAYLAMSGWNYVFVFACAVIAVGFLTKLFIIQHDCGHGSYFEKKKLNDWIGRLIGVLTIVPYDYWKKTHDIHHQGAGNLDARGLGDIDTLTVGEYLSRSRRGRVWYRIYRNPFIFLFVGSMLTFMVKHRFPWNIPRDGTWRREWRSVWWTNAGIVLLSGGACLLLGWKVFLLVQAPITLLTGVVGIWLFYVQHQYEGTYWRRKYAWEYDVAAIEGSSFYDLPRWLHWFTGNIGYHHIHHLNPRVPSYKLPGCAKMIGNLAGVTKLTLRTSLGCAWLALWDESRRELIRFRDIPRDGPRIRRKSA